MKRFFSVSSRFRWVLLPGVRGLELRCICCAARSAPQICFFDIGAGLAPRLIISPTALAAAAVIGVVTTVISAYLPARRAVKVPPIEAVRRSNDITAKQVKVRGNGIIYKLFGFEGMIAAKNFRRNKKQYRTAILSLFMSVVLFVSASSFCRYLTDAAGDVDRSAGYDISYVMNDAYNTDAADRIYSALCKGGRRNGISAAERGLASGCDAVRVFFVRKGSAAAVW